MTHRLTQRAESARSKRDLTDAQLKASADRCHGCKGEENIRICEAAKQQGACRVAASNPDMLYCSEGRKLCDNHDPTIKLKCTACREQRKRIAAQLPPHFGEMRQRKGANTAAADALMEIFKTTRIPVVDVTPRPAWTRKNKYGAIKTNCGQGHRHDSKAEAARCDYWQGEKVAGRILHVDIQPKVTLACGAYRPDFQIWEGGGDRVSCFYEDTKGVVTAEFRRIRKTFDATHPAAPLHVIAKKGQRWITL